MSFDPGALLHALVFALLATAGAGLLWLLAIRPAKGVPLRTWRLVLPRGASFDPSQAAAWFLSFTPLLRKTATFPAVEIRRDHRELSYRVTAPADWEGHLRGQLAAWFPGARLEPVKPPEPERPVHVPAVSLPLRSERAGLYSLRLPGQETTDPLLGVLGALRAAPGDCGLRLVFGPPPREWRWWSAAALDALRAGRALPPSGWLFWLSLLLSTLRTSTGKTASPSELRPSVPESVSRKLREPVFACEVRVWAAAGEGSTAGPQARELAAQLELAYRDPVGNALVPARRGGDAVQAMGPGRHGPRLVLSAAELAALFHVPGSAHPLVECEPCRQVAPTAGTLAGGPLDSRPVTWLGEALVGERAERFGLTIEERRLHTYVVGKTGTGKSTLLATLLRQDLAGGRGVGLIDPHGDLAERVLSLIPPSRAGELLYFNAADSDYPVGFNLLAASTPASRPLVASGVVGVFKKLYGESWGPRLEHFLRNAVLALLEAPSPSLLLLPRLLTDREYRHRVLAHVRDPLLRSFFLEEYEAYDPRWRAEAISPILNKVGQFLASPVVRHLVGQSGPGFDLRQLMDRGGIFVANLASGRIGEDNCDLLGGLLVAGFQLAAMSRAAQPEAERRDFFLCVDEFQHFANDAFGAILSEARKYRLSLTLSHQYLDQVDAPVSDAIFGNTGSLCVFRVGAGDTGRLVKELAPSFDAQDLVSQPNFRFCARPARLSGAGIPFSARTVPLETPDVDLTPLLEASRRRWARSRVEVELDIADRWEGRAE
ncbi:MAG: type IV secretory system conjugative DNA transfer family protein [Armatimonadota bacterium]